VNGINDPGGAFSGNLNDPNVTVVASFLNVTGLGDGLRLAIHKAAGGTIASTFKSG